MRLDIRVSQLISLVERWSGRSRTKPSPMVRRILAAPPTARQGGCRGGDARQKSSAYEREARFEALGGHRGGSRKVICLACSEGRNRASFSLFIYHLGSTRPQHRGGPSRRRQQAAWHTHADIIGRAKVAPTPINVCTVCWRAPRFYPLPAKMRLCDPIQLCRIAVALPAPSDRVLPLPCFDKRREEKIYLIYHIYLF